MPSSAKHYAARRVWADSLKAERGFKCADCGEIFEDCPAILEWDHVRGKKLGVPAQMVKWARKALVLAEIAKCDLVCANCHRRRTVRRGDYQRR